MPRTVRIVSGLLLVCLAHALVLADEPPPKQVAVPQAKKAEAKKSDEKEKKKAKAPAGYEDAPEAGEPPPAREAAVVVDPFRDDQFDAQVVNLEKQIAPQLTPLMTAELSFINRACNLTLEQRQKIKAASDTCLKAAARKYAMAQSGLMNGWAGRRVQLMVPDPNELLHQALAKVLEETLQPEQQTAYAGEMAKREAYRKRVTIDNMIAILDERLVLTLDQRQQLVESLEKNWQPAWVQSLEMLMNNNESLPNIPDQFVVPTLTETQKQVWRAAPKQNYAMWGGFNWARQGGALDDFPLVEAGKPVPAAGR